MPLSTRFTTARVVSNRNSSIGRGRPSEVCSQHDGDVGWMRTRAPAPVELVEHRLPRRVAEVGAADVGEQHEPVDVEVVDGSARSRRSRASTSGSGSEPSRPKRPGWSTTARRPASFTSRARSRAAASSARWTPGDEIDRSDVAIPSRSITATCSSADHVRDLAACRRVGRGRRAGALAGRSGQVVGVDVDLAGRLDHRPKSKQAHRVGVRLDHVVRLGVEAGEPATLRREHEHRRTGAGEDVVEVRGRDGRYGAVADEALEQRDRAGRRADARGARRGSPCARCRPCTPA